MHIRIARSALLRELSLLAGVVEKKVTIPILSKVLLMSWPTGHVSLAATNASESLLSDTIPAEVLVAGQAALPADLLVNFLRAAADGLVTIEATAKATHAELTSGQTRLRLPLADVAEFPQLPNATEVAATVPAGELRELFRQTRHAAPSQQLGSYIHGILVELSPKKILMAAMDGHRLGLSYRTLATPIEEGQRFILPVRACGALDAMLAESDDDAPVSISSSENVACFRVESRLFTARLLDLRFPAYATIINRLKHSTVVDVDREALLQEMKRMAVVVTKERQAVLLDIRDKHVFLELDSEVGRITGQVLADIAGEDAKVMVNLHYALEFLSLLGTSSMKIGYYPEGKALELGPAEPGVTCVLGTVAMPKAAAA